MPMPRQKLEAGEKLQGTNYCNWPGIEQELRLGIDDGGPVVKRFAEQQI